MELFPKQSNNQRVPVFLPAEILILIAREIPNKASKCYLCAVNKFTWSLRKSLDPVGTNVIEDAWDYDIAEFFDNLYSVEPSFLRKYIRGKDFWDYCEYKYKYKVKKAYEIAYHAGDDETLLCIRTCLKRLGLPVSKKIINITSQSYQNHDNPPRKFIHTLASMISPAQRESLWENAHWSHWRAFPAGARLKPAQELLESGIEYWNTINILRGMEILCSIPKVNPANTVRRLLRDDVGYIFLFQPLWWINVIIPLSFIGLISEEVLGTWRYEKILEFQDAYWNC